MTNPFTLKEVCQNIAALLKAERQRKQWSFSSVPSAQACRIK